MRGSFIPLEAVLAGRHPDLGHVYDGQVEGVRCLGMTDAPLVLAWFRIFDDERLKEEL
jgi:hypothetical protein